MISRKIFLKENVKDKSYDDVTKFGDEVIQLLFQKLKSVQIE